MFAFIIGYFNDNLYVPMSMFISILEILGGSHYVFYITWMFTAGVTTFICLELHYPFFGHLLAIETNLVPTNISSWQSFYNCFLSNYRGFGILLALGL